jgi:signal transduction histidine kinase
LKQTSTADNLFPGWTMLSAIVGVVGVIALLLLSLINDFHDANQHARVEAENISRLLEEQVFATVNKADLLLREVQRNVRPDDMKMNHTRSGSRRQELHALLKSQLESVPEIAVIHITDASGNHIYSSLDPVPHINVADRYHFTRHRDDAAAGLVISPPLVSRTTGKWTVVLTRRLNFEDGSFAGVALVILDLEYFQQFYRSLNLGARGLVALYDKELHLAARYPPSEKDMGKVSNIYAKTYIEKGITQATYHAQSALDGIKRLFSFRQVGDLPLIVFAGIAEDDYLADSQRHVWQYGVGAIIFCLVVMGFVLRQQRDSASIFQLNSELEQRVAQRTAELETAIYDLENFNYSASHDLRVPLRAVDGYSKILLAEYSQQLDDEGKRLLNVVRDNTKKMAQFIDDMLAFSGTGRMAMVPSEVNMDELVLDVVEELKPATAGRELKLDIRRLPPVLADRNMIRRVVVNLLSNAIKFTRPKATALIEVGAKIGGNETIYYVKDNGAGFDMRYADKLFGVFQRLHGPAEFEGTGIGLAIVKRIIIRHGGRVWAEGKVNEGATIYFALPAKEAARG